MEEQEEEEAPAITRNKFDEILVLFNLYWFHHLILFKYPPTPTPPPPPPPPPHPMALSGPRGQPPSLSSQPLRDRRTRSDEPISTFLHRPVKPLHLLTIPSQKESLNPIQSRQLHLTDMDAIKRRILPKNRLRRSKSELELEELKGLMDLGFNLSDAEVERHPELTDIVPGLRKSRSEGKGKGKGKLKMLRQPYLSEAWSFRDEEERKRVLGDWSVLVNGDERDVKEQLRQWAHVVASSRPAGPFGEG